MNKSANLEGITILLVEDDEFNQRFMKRSLENLQANVLLAVHGKEAIALKELAEVDLILMDLQMPVMNGFEAVEHIRKKLKLSMPILALSGSELDEDKERALSLGCQDYLVKPCSGKVLFESIYQSLSKDAAGVMDSEEKSEDESINEELFSLAKLEEISRGNPAFVDKMIKMLLEEMPVSLVLLKEHLENKEYDRLKAVAHKMKPSVNLMAMKSISETIQTIEDYAGSESNLEELPKLVAHVISVGEVVLQELKNRS